MELVFDLIFNFLLLVVHTLLSGYRVVLGLVSLGLITLGLFWIAPLFLEINYSYQLPVCGLYWQYPRYARIIGSNTLILRARGPGTTFVAREGNYLMTLGEPIDLDPHSPTKKVAIDFHVAPSSLLKVPAEKGEIVVDTTNPNCRASLDIELNSWATAFRFVGAIITLLPATVLLRMVFS